MYTGRDNARRKMHQNRAIATQDRDPGAVAEPGIGVKRSEIIEPDRREDNAQESAIRCGQPTHEKHRRHAADPPDLRFRYVRIGIGRAREIPEIVPVIDSVVWRGPWPGLVYEMSGGIENAEGTGLRQ